MDRILWILLGLLALTVAILVTAESSGFSLGMDNDNFAQTVYLGALIAALVAGGTAWRGGLSSALRNAAIWLALIFAFAALYTWSDTVREWVTGRF